MNRIRRYLMTRLEPETPPVAGGGRWGSIFGPDIFTETSAATFPAREEMVPYPRWVYETNPDDLAHGGGDLARQLHHPQRHQADLDGVSRTLTVEAVRHAVRITDRLHLPYRKKQHNAGELWCNNTHNAMRFTIPVSPCHYFTPRWHQGSPRFCGLINNSNVRRFPRL